MDEFDFERFYIKLTKRNLIKKSEKIDIYTVLDEEADTIRILKICKGRDLSTVCKTLKEVKDSNVAIVYDYVYYNGDTYILEEKLQGETLGEKLEVQGTLSPEETVRIITKVCDGLSVLHNMEPPVIHRDIKPSNIFICDDGNVKVFDFDISRTYKETADCDTQIFATRAYASPEHHGYGQTDQCSDIYSLGVTMHKMLSGKVLNDKRQTTYAGKLSEIINKCVQMNPEARFQSAEELRIALLEQISYEASKISESQAKKDTDKQKSHGKGKFLAVLIALIIVGALVFGAGKFVKGFLEEDHNQPADTNVVGSDLLTGDNALSSTEKTTKSTYATILPDKKDKAVKVVSKTEGEVLSMVALNDGTIVYLEAFKDECHIKTSAGMERVLPLEGQNCRLLYNGYTDDLYMIYRESGTTNAKIYLIDKNYEIADVPLFEANYGYDSGSSGFFLSDGTLYSDFFDKNLIDSTQWVEIGSASFEASTQFNDRMFYINDFTVTEEIGYGAESVYYNAPWDYLCDAKYYTADDGIYFIAKTSGKEYIYKFDGETFIEEACLDNYKYYTRSEYKRFVVSNDKIWLYDATANTIKELSIE